MQTVCEHLCQKYPTENRVGGVYSSWLLISASLAARITGVSHWCLVKKKKGLILLLLFPNRLTSNF
jgi:hypothetical protein